MMCGRTGYTPITTWARSQKALAKSIGWTDGETPCAPTIHNLLKRIDVDALEKALTKWVNQVVESCPKLSSCLDAVAMVNREQVALDAGTQLGEDASLVRCGAMSKIIFVVQRTALSVFQLAG